MYVIQGMYDTEKLYAVGLALMPVALAKPR